MEYLGFTIGWGWWRPSECRTAAISKTKVKSVQDLRAFLGACNFLRRHIKNFTETSVELTDLLRKDAPWKWTERHEALLEELKQKIVSRECLGVPRSKGDFVVVTDASDLGGGGSIFQWQIWDIEEELRRKSTSGCGRVGTRRHGPNGYPDRLEHGRNRAMCTVEVG